MLGCCLIILVRPSLGVPRSFSQILFFYLYDLPAHGFHNLHCSMSKISLRKSLDGVFAAGLC